MSALSGRRFGRRLRGRETTQVVPDRPRRSCGRFPLPGSDLGLALADDDTKLIPGHGELSGVDELRAYRAMLKTVHGRVQKMIADGKPLEEVVAARPTRDLDAEWGGGFMKPDQWVGLVYASMAR
ncbi:MAG: hypothetical protein ACYS15_18685 [Planctomycetota bacterium]